MPIEEFAGLNTTIISQDLFFKVTYQSFVERVAKEEGSDGESSVSTLDGWSVTNFTKREMIVKLNFSNPKMVSASSNRDIITI